VNVRSRTAALPLPTGAWLPVAAVLKGVRCFDLDRHAVIGLAVETSSGQAKRAPGSGVLLRWIATGSGDRRRLAGQMRDGSLSADSRAASREVRPYRRCPSCTGVLAASAT
jgi:hypothetical protein